MKNNKGFSLVELIIVIAIMAILVGVMAPQLIKYIEKTNVSSDTQLADTVKSAVTTAMMDPSVIANTSNGIPAADTWVNVSGMTSNTSDVTYFNGAVKEILGFEPSDINSRLKSTHASTAQVQFMIVGSNAVHVKITGTDSTGKKDTATASKNIYVD